MEFFVKFIAKGLMYNQGMLSIHHKYVILCLRVTTRKVNDAFARILPSYLRQVEAFKPAKPAIRLLSMAAEKKSLTQTESLAV